MQKSNVSLSFDLGYNFSFLMLSLVSLQVDLQQMEVSCDPEQAYSEGCCELSGVVSQPPVNMVSHPSVGDVCVKF